MLLIMGKNVGLCLYMTAIQGHICPLIKYKLQLFLSSGQQSNYLPQFDMSATYRVTQSYIQNPDDLTFNI